MNRSYSKNTYTLELSFPQASQMLLCSIPVAQLLMRAVKTVLQYILSEAWCFSA